MKYYKVVRENLKSAVINSETDLSVQYKIGEFVEGIFKSGLFVFDSLEGAELYSHHLLKWGDYQVYEVETKNLVKTVFKSIYGTSVIIRILKLRKNKKKYLHLMDKSDTPLLGTKCFKQVKLIKRVS